LTQSASVAFTASLLSTLQLWRHHLSDDNPLLQGWTASPDLIDALSASVKIVNSAAAILQQPIKFPSSGAESLQFNSTSKLQKKLQGFQQLIDVNNLKATRLMSATARALYLSKTCRGASAFLQAVPTDRHLLLSNETMHTALRVRFQISVLSDQGVTARTPCLCNPSAQPLTDTHLFNCGADAARDMRHNVLVLAFQDMLSDVQNNPVQLEPRAARTGGDHHRFDLAVTGFDSASRNLLLDVTVRSPYAERVIDQAAVNRLEAANKGAHEKYEHYKAYKSDQDLFWPLALETFGGLHHNVFKLLASCASRVGGAPPDSASPFAPTFSSYWLQRISCTLWRENARLVSYLCTQSLRLAGLSDDSQ